MIPIKSQNGVPQEYKRDRQGKLVTSKLNEIALREIADAGNGIYVRFDNRLTGHRNLIQAIDSIEKKTKAQLANKFNFSKNEEDCN